MEQKTCQETRKPYVEPHVVPFGSIVRLTGS
jgi:hypothetical protein